MKVLRAVALTVCASIVAGAAPPAQAGAPAASKIDAIVASGDLADVRALVRFLEQHRTGTDVLARLAIDERGVVIETGVSRGRGAGHR